MPRALLLLLFLVAIAVWETAGSLVGRRGGPREEDWQAVERLLRAEYAPGDLIVFSPAWIDPVGRAHLGDLLPVEAAARPDAEGYARVWVVSFGRPRRVPELAGRTEVKRQEGRLSVGLYTGTPPEVAFDFVANLGSPGVQAAGAQVRMAEVDFEPHRCIVIQPGPAPRSIVFPSVRLGRSIVGYTGLDHFHQRKLGKGLVELAVHIGDQLKERIVHANDAGWRRFEIDTSGSAGTTQPVRFDVSAPDPRHRVFCFHAEARI